MADDVMTGPGRRGRPKVPLFGRKMSELELGWVTGFLEGEGYFGSHAKSRSPCVIVSQVQREPLERLMRYTGLGTVRGPYARQSSRQSPIHRWTSEGGRIIPPFLKTIRPMMSPRRQTQIDTAISVYETHRLSRDAYKDLCRRSAVKQWETKNTLRAMKATHSLKVVIGGSNGG